MGLAYKERKSVLSYLAISESCNFPSLLASKTWSCKQTSKQISKQIRFINTFQFSISIFKKRSISFIAGTVLAKNSALKYLRSKVNRKKTSKFNKLARSLKLFESSYCKESFFFSCLVIFNFFSLQHSNIRRVCNELLQ